MSASDHGQQRPAELEDWLNRTLYHPLSYRLARLLRGTPVTPNAVSVTGGAVVIAAAAVYYISAGIAGGIWGAMLGMVLHVTWHVLDGADGDLARMTGRSSELGEIIDGVCDYVSHIVLYVVLAAILAAQIGPLGWPVMVAAGLARAVQAVFFETQRRQYQYWVYGTPWLRVSARPSPDAHGSKNRGVIGAVLAWLAGGYLRFGTVISAGGTQLDARLHGRNGPARDAGKDPLTPIIAARLKPVIASISVLSANYRTLVIGAAMILGMPILIAAFELIGLTVFAVFAWRRAGREIAHILDYSPDKTDR